jgi:hypothetical protein
MKGPLADLAALATEVDEHVQAFTKATPPRPRDAIRALEAALNPVRTDVTRDPVTETTTDSAVEDSRTPAAINKFVKRLTATSRRAAEKSTARDDTGAQPSKPRHARKDATESSDGSAKANASNGSKDRGHRGARHVKAGAKD